MPLTVITLKNSPPSLRGDLTKWMQEISTGVYVGNFNTKIRQELWARVIESLGNGEATMTYTYRNEIGYKFETHNSSKIPIDFDGIDLVLSPKPIREEKTEKKLGFSKAAKARKAKKFAEKSSKTNRKTYVIIDLETTGLEPTKDRIIEIGAIKIGEKTEEFTCLIKQDIGLSEEIKNLTGISDKDLENGVDEKSAINDLIDFISEDILVGYNIDFDIKFLNQALKDQGRGKIANKTYDIMKYVKNEKMFLNSYKLETVLKEYGIEKNQPHSALEDTRLMQELLVKVDSLVKRLEKQSE